MRFKEKIIMFFKRYMTLILFAIAVKVTAVSIYWLSS